MRILKNLHLILALCAVLSASGQKLKFSRLTSEDGLSQSSVNCIVQDQDGFMWFGTQDGLNKYDGYRFTVYRANSNDDKSLVDKYIRSLLVDHNGVLWVGTNKGLSRYNAYQDSWVTYPFKDEIERAVLSLHELKSGQIWVGTSEGLYEVKENILSPKSVKGASKEVLTSADVTCFLTDKSGQNWIGTKEGLFTYDTEHDDFLPYPIELGDNINDKILQSKNRIKHVFEDSDGNVWLSTQGAGLLKINSGSKDITAHIHIEEDDNSISYDAVTGVIERLPGELWVGTTTMLNVHKKEMPGSFRRYSADNGGEFGISSNSISCIYKDRNGIIWLGTDGGGVSVFKQLNNQFNHFNRDNFAAGCLLSDEIMGFTQDPDGKLWIATYSKAYISFNPLTNECELFPFPANRNHNKILTIYADKEGLIWVGSHGGGLNYFDPQTGKFSVPFTDDVGPEDNRISSNDVLSITEDGDGNLWIGTLKGLNKYEKSTGQFTNYYTTEGLAGNFVNDIVYDDARKELWVGTTRGVSLMNIKEGSVINYTHDAEDENTISDNYVFCIHKDSNGNVWLGTSAGLNRFNRVTGKITRYTKANGLPNDNIYGILEDEEQNLWLSSNKGLIMVKPNDASPDMRDVKHYLEQDGMQSNEFNQGAFYKTRDGQMFFGGMEGFNAFFPREIKSNNHPPELYFTSFKLFDKEVQLDTAIGKKRFIELSYKDRFFSFEFVALDFQQPSKIMYSWKLEGLEDEWKLPTTRRYATYNNLKGGDYVFRVRACNNDGLWNEEGIAVHIRVIPPFWETTWFRILAVLVIAAGVFIFIRVRTEKIKRENKILEEKVKERTAELNEKNEEIIASIMYAKRIQEAILPPKELIYRHFPNAFVLYEPKDIVSGDFYWFGVKDNKEIIAAVDCTGHGVPGAFMSMIGSNLLQQVIVENNITDPGKILTELNARVKSALKQDDSSGVQTADGMDLALCTIDKSKNLIEFAGAFRPLYMVRDGEVVAFKADKAPIGGGRHIDDIEFTNNQIEYQPGDSIYMFSDGYADQFGGDRGKKFMAKRFRDLLLDVNGKSMQEQGAELKTALTDWQGAYEQVDDVLVIGIQL